MPEKAKLMSVPDLESCLNQIVRIYRSTEEGEIFTDAKIILLQIPYQMQVECGSYDGGIWKVTLGKFLTFAGGQEGITKIEKEDKIVYKNKKIPVPYLQFPFTEEGFNALNQLRKGCFGEEYGCTKPEGFEFPT